MPDLVIRIKKKNDGTAALTCTRADGTVTWQRQDKQLGQFFPFHDITHFAVESVLGFDRAFYGLVAGGWDIDDFERPEARAEMIGEAQLAELIVGYFDLERATGHRIAADDCNEKARAFFADRGLRPPEFAVDDAQLDAVRARRDELFTQWRAAAPGAALEIEFSRRAERGA